MRNLSAEMARFGVSNADLQDLLGCTSKTVSNKLADTTEFSVSIFTALWRSGYLSSVFCLTQVIRVTFYIFPRCHHVI